MKNEHPLRTILDSLNIRERKVLACRFGIGCAPMTLSEVGIMLNVTRERVRQIEQIALNKLRCRASILNVNFDDLI